VQSLNKTSFRIQVAVYSVSKLPTFAVTSVLGSLWLAFFSVISLPLCGRESKLVAPDSVAYAIEKAGDSRRRPSVVDFSRVRFVTSYKA
jgi:hypothetical protein